MEPSPPPPEKSISDRQPIAAPAKSPRRRWLQFSIRSLLLLTFIVAAIFAYWVRPSLRQRDAIAALRDKPFLPSLDDHLKYDFEEENRLARGPRYVPGWLVNCVGIDFFADVEYLELCCPDDDDLAQLSALSGLKTLSIYGNGFKFTENGLTHLRHLKSLERLDISETGISDAALVHLSALTQLSSLKIAASWDEVRISDQGLVHLRSLTNLQELDLSGANITDAGLVHLRALPKLSKLNLGETKVTPQGKASFPQILIAEVQVEQLLRHPLDRRPVGEMRPPTVATSSEQLPRLPPALRPDEELPPPTPAATYSKSLVPPTVVLPDAK